MTPYLSPELECLPIKRELGLQQELPSKPLMMDVKSNLPTTEEFGSKLQRGILFLCVQLTHRHVLDVWSMQNRDEIPLASCV